MPEAATTSAFDHPPAEVQRYFDAKGLKPSFDWRDLSFDEHAHAFSVAKSAGYDILADVKGALSQAIAERQDFAQFAKGLEPLLKSKGWWGKAAEIDPLTGEEKLVQLGSPARLKTIYWANVNSAYAAGEWERVQRTKRVLPYLQYLHTTAEHPRPQHLAWVGTILPVDDAWWATHYPPNGWGCQCRVRQLSDGEAERYGYDADDPDRPADFGAKTYVNKRTGEEVEVPVGIDPGWAQNPGMGRARTAADFLAGRVDAMSPEAREAAVADLADSWLVKRIASGTIPFDPASRDPAMVNRGAIAAPIAALTPEIHDKVKAPAFAVRLSVADAQRIGAPAESYALVQALIDAGEATDVAGTIVVTGELAGETWSAALRRDEAAGGALYLESLDRIDGE
jgi:SPP1 gp7 family putative phage head morphogenesis protein